MPQKIRHITPPPTNESEYHFLLNKLKTSVSTSDTDQDLFDYFDNIDISNKQLLRYSILLLKDF